MSSFKRYLYDQVLKDLSRKMVFIGGPRQVGKTTLSQCFLGDASQKGYLNWDIAAHKEQILNQEFPMSPIWIFDEIHKYSAWRNYLKGVYDQFGATQRILVTGSARLDLYRRGGDSLQGRFHYLRLYPLSVAELGLTTQAEFEHLLRRGGFPEPYFSPDDIDAKRWSQAYRKRLIQDEILSLETVKDLGNLELMMIRLPALVGSPLSINGLREDIGVSHATVSNWMRIFSQLYAVFQLPPFGAPTLRAVKKEQKHYHFDWTLIDENGPRFENLVALHLLKWVHFQQDVAARDIELTYFRDVDGREVDFVVVEKGAPIYAIECKFSDGTISKSLRYFKKKFPEVKAFQLTATGTKEFINKDGIVHAHCLSFLSELI